MTKVVLVRHGQTEWTMSQRHTGRTDIPLTEQGRQEARNLGRLLSTFDFDLVLASPALRTHETASLAGLAASTVTDPDLWEWDYGDYEGARTSDTRREIEGWSVWTHEMTGGESLQQVGERCDRVVQRIKRVAGDVAVFGHGHALRVLASRWLDQDPGFGARLVLSPASLSILGYERETPAIILWNEPAPEA